MARGGAPNFAANNMNGNHMRGGAGRGYAYRGGRGYGGGYYDRTLEKLRKRPRLVGIAFAAQELGEIPREPHDVPLDVIVTEQGARSFEHIAA